MTAPAPGATTDPVTSLGTSADASRSDQPRSVPEPGNGVTSDAVAGTLMACTGPVPMLTSTSTLMDQPSRASARLSLTAVAAVESTDLRVVPARLLAWMMGMHWRPVSVAILTK